MTRNTDTADISEGDRVEITDPATDTVLVEGPVSEVTPQWFAVEGGRGHGPRRYTHAPDNMVQPVDGHQRYTVEVQPIVTDGGITKPFDFEDAAPDEDSDDDEGELVFRPNEVFTAYGDAKVAVETPAPWNTPDEMTPANEVIKNALSWEDSHRTFDDEREAWTLDRDALPTLKEAAEDAGYEWEPDIGGNGSGEDADAQDERKALLRDLCGFAASGAKISVEYEKKNGNGRNTYRGTVQRTSDDHLRFEDEDGKAKFISPDDDGVPALYSNGRYPFMGTVTSVTVAK